MARSGHEYGDRTGIEYEYPRGRYESLIQPGAQFVYQVPKVGYIGAGVIGEIRASTNPERLVCDILSANMFDQPVALKDPNGAYYEADPLFWKDKVYWGQGVRPLSESRLEAIVLAGGVPATFVADAARGGYASPAVTRAVEDYSVAVVVNELEKQYAEPVVVMPRNHPGFDIRVGPGASPVRYVEVKGTQSTDSVFFMSDGERRFSMANADKYTLFIVSGINLKAGTHSQVSKRNGPVDGEDFELRPHQWRGRLLKPA